MKTKLTIYKDKKGEYRWHMKRSGRIVAESGEGYKRVDGAKRTLFNLIIDIKVSEEICFDLVAKAIEAAERNKFRKG